jgi:hypothetical protein
MAPRRIEYEPGAKSDSQGRCHFTLFWWAQYHPGHPEGEFGQRERAQCYFADPQTYGFLRPEEQKEDVDKNKRRMSMIIRLKEPTEHDLRAAFEFELRHSRFTAEVFWRDSALVITTVRKHQAESYCGNHPGPCQLDRRPLR